MRSQDYHIYIKPVLIPNIVELVNHILVSKNIIIVADDDSNLSLNDYEVGDEEFYFCVEEITNPISDLNKIKYNPTGGWICYQNENHNILVCFEPIDCPLYYIDNVTIIVSYNLYYFEQKMIDDVIKILHNELNAIRTIGGENISEDVDTVKNELANTKKGIFPFEYAIDLRGSIE